jgi:hypothetical protein
VHVRDAVRLRPLAVLAGAVVLAASACGFGFGPAAVDADGPRLQTQARAALDRWTAAVAAGGGSDLAPVDELVGQIGDWEAAVGDNKAALMAGQVEAAITLPGDTPPDGDVTWSDGTSESVALVPAAQAFAGIRTAGGGSCDGCAPLRVTGSRLTTATIRTSRGPATVPVWAFTVVGTAVQITRVAVANMIIPVPPPWDPKGTADGRDLGVTFVGAPGPASQGCGADYTAEAVESDTAMVVIVHEHSNPGGGACALVGATRTASVTLASPLGKRAVLEIKEGRPVPVTLGP